MSTPAWRHRFARPATAWALFVTIVAMFAAFAVIFYSPITPPALYQAGGGISGFFVFPFASFAVVGLLIATRRPGNPIGWLCLGATGLLAVGSLSALVGSLLFGTHNAVGGYVLLLSAFWNAPGGNSSVLFLMMLIVFPDGHLRSPRWRWVAYAVVAVGVTGLILNVVNPTPGVLGIASGQPAHIALPVSILAIAGSADLVNALATVWNVMSNVLGVAVLVSMFLRLRGADADRRHQIKWVATAGVLLSVVFIIISILPSAGAPPGPLATAIIGVVVTAAELSVPAAIGIAVLKYRLYDIDVIISRTLVYGTLAAFITAVYIGIAVGLGTLVGSGGQPNLGLSILATIIVAVGFQPVRERLQKVANRLVYGKRATPYEVLSDFSAHVAETYGADEVLPRMARVLQDGTGADVATVWLREGSVLRPAATSPGDVVGYEPLRMSDGVLPIFPGTTRSVEVRHQGELLGALSVIKRRGESLTPLEQKLVDDLALQAGLVLKNVGLTAELLHRIDDLRASRQRLVTAQDDARRRLERNLHDGAQQNLVALKVKLGLAQMLAARDPAQARATVAELKADADEALETLRDLARGVYPPLLAERGLVAALESQGRKATVPVTVAAEGVDRYPQDIEATVYFCALEALQNVQKYARAQSVQICLRGDGRTLTFEISDDGAGFDPQTATKGAGLGNMADRIDAIGGTLSFESQPGHGTRVRGELPLLEAVTA